MEKIVGVLVVVNVIQSEENYVTFVVANDKVNEFVEFVFDCLPQDFVAKVKEKFGYTPAVSPMIDPWNYNVH